MGLPSYRETDRNIQRLKKYLGHYAIRGPWKILSAGTAGIKQVVVIPALAEKNHLFHTLCSLAANPHEDLSWTLVLIVVNNSTVAEGDDDIYEDNQFTLHALQELIAGRRPVLPPAETSLQEIIDIIHQTPLRLGVIDASSAGFEMTARMAGVGTARKLGMDLALAVFSPNATERQLLICLDADTRVEPNYLNAVRLGFNESIAEAGVIVFAHPLPEEQDLQAAMVCYELFLRYYVLALSWAGSPYAFHSIGSTMACTPERYVAVRGMSRKEAGEDFYFLNKLRKTGEIKAISETVVHPSARSSVRVPFGTGKRMIRHLKGDRDEYLLYDPRIFVILKAWLNIMEDDTALTTPELLTAAACVHPRLRSFLEVHHFQDVWPRILSNTRDIRTRQRAFHTWFDGFITMKLVHDLTESACPLVSMDVALLWLMGVFGKKDIVLTEKRFSQDMEAQKKTLMTLRVMDQPPNRREYF